MGRLLATAALAGAAFLCGCSPGLDWRDTRVEATALRAMFPCKPQADSHPVTLAGRELKLQALVCRAGASTFALLFADVGSPAMAAPVLREWKAASLARLHSDQARESHFVPAGALQLSESVQLMASGKRPDGSPVQMRAAYFAHGPHVFEAVIYTGQHEPGFADPFFDGLRFE
jgi:hypothetical protein